MNIPMIFQALKPAAMPCHEAVVRNTDLDFLLVRPMGVDPAEPQRGSYALLTGRGQGGLEITMAKEDVALLLGISGIRLWWLRRKVRLKWLKYVETCWNLLKPRKNTEEQ